MKAYILLLIIFMIKNTSIVADQQKQTMPIASVWHTRAYELMVPVKEIKRLFLEDVKKYQYENDQIPAKNEMTCRVVTFNIRMWTNLSEQSNFENIRSVIKKLAPDIIILQEVNEWGKTYNYFTQLGYSQCAASCITKNPCFGPAIFAKNCEVNYQTGRVFKHQWNSARELSYVRLDIEIKGKHVSIYGTHLEVEQFATQESVEEVRKKQLEEIFDDMQKLSHQNVILAGDFNSVRAQDYYYQVGQINAWDMLQKMYEAILNKPYYPVVLDLVAKNKFRSSFELLDWQGPKFTNWSGNVLDFIFVSPSWNFPVVGSYVYYTDVSDHLPVIVDIKI